MIALTAFAVLFLHRLAGASVATFHPDRILVMPRSNTPEATLRSHHQSQGREILRTFPGLGGMQVIQRAADETLLSALASCRANPLLSWAEPDFRVSASAVLPDDPFFQNGTQWWLNNYGQNNGLPDADIDAPDAWDLHRTASSVIVAILDTGVRATHEDLVGNLWRDPLDGSHGFNAITGRTDPSDDNGHGTHLAGIIGAVGNNTRGVSGVAWRPQLMICKFLDATGNGFHSDAIACVEFARAHGAHVLNLSWGGGQFSVALSNALRAASSDGLVVVAAAGNNLANTDLSPYYPASLKLDNLVAVGASTRNDERWTFSSYGATTVHLFAPGEAIYSTARTTDQSYETRNGTSMAAAVVAGTMALLREQSPGASPAELIQRLLAAVEVKPAFARRCLSGGRLNLRRALDHPALTLDANAGDARVTVSGVPGHRYVLTTSSNLTAWTAVYTNMVGPDGLWRYSEPNVTNVSARFYRALPGP
jgi:subtilisin family serine protease